MAEKPLGWVGSSLDDVRAFPAEVRREAAHQLHRVQLGLMPDDWKPMGSVGRGVCEIRIRTGREHRVFYVARFEEAIYVLHAFEKRTQRTRRADLDLGRQRLAEVLGARQRRQGTAMTTRIRRSSGNVFRDLGFRPEEAESLRVRSELMIELSKLIKKRRMTQAEAAELLGVTQPRISDLVRGRIDRFSVDSLIDMLGRAGVHVRITVSRGGKVA